MPKLIEDLARAHQNQLREEMPNVVLYEMEIPETPPQRIRVTNYTQAIPYGRDLDGEPIVYSPIAIVHEGVRASKEGDLPSIQVQVGNASHGGALPGNRVSDMVEAYDGLEGQPVIIRVVNIQCLDEPTATFRIDTQITKIKVRNERVVMDLSPFNVFDAPFPPVRFKRKGCWYRFGDARCGYVAVAGATNTVGGGFDFCERTLPACRTRGEDEAARGADVLHPLRFGGKKGIPGRANR